jgi:uncharacterized membrane protein YkvA (DUF1232 family)
MWRLVRALPTLTGMIAKLARDPGLPRTAKLALLAAAVYLASPIDLVPDFIPLVGYLDDVLLAAIVLDGILNYVDRDVVLRYWPGHPQTLDKLARTARLLAGWVPAGVKSRIFSPRR